MKIFTNNSKSNIVFCCVDTTSKINSGWTKELIKNITDYVVSDLSTKHFDVIMGTDEDELLLEAKSKNYEYAVVFSTGTEFHNFKENNFFKSIQKLLINDFFIAGHILDRKEGYYELHHQCYIVNLIIYRTLRCPKIGQQELNSTHQQIEPVRSIENLHDNYTPTWINTGSVLKNYNHKII